MTDLLVSVLRGMSWERAKGELNAILATYYPNYDLDNPHDEYETFKKMVEEFIQKVEDEGLIE